MNKNNQRPSSKRLSFLHFSCLAVLIMTGADVVFSANTTKKAPVTNIKASPNKASSNKASSNKTSSLKAEKALAPVMDPGQFFGAASLGYAAAKSCPEVVSKLFCYCGCDITDNHTSLLDCFTSLHGVDCHICQEEAMLALRLNNEGVSLAEIQKRIDQQYSSQYPFEKDTETYKKYKANRLWTKGDKSAEQNLDKSGNNSSSASNSVPDSKPKNKVVPGCCSK